MLLGHNDRRYFWYLIEYGSKYYIKYHAKYYSEYCSGERRADSYHHA
jgi:hypothetical protein